MNTFTPQSFPVLPGNSLVPLAAVLCTEVTDDEQRFFSERQYDYFRATSPAVEEALLVPFYIEGTAVGTIWAIAHDDRRTFDA